jgi:hypothetical protein
VSYSQHFHLKTISGQGCREDNNNNNVEQQKPPLCSSLAIGRAQIRDQVQNARARTYEQILSCRNYVTPNRLLYLTRTTKQSSANIFVKKIRETAECQKVSI